MLQRVRSTMLLKAYILLKPIKSFTFLFALRISQGFFLRVSYVECFTGCIKLFLQDRWDFLQAPYEGYHRRYIKPHVSELFIFFINLESLFLQVFCIKKINRILVTP